MNRVTLIGFRACGKSTVGRLVAARLAWPFIDADAATETELGMPIQRAIPELGESAFRDAETRALAAVLERPGPLVLATGGGVVLRPQNRDHLRRAGGLVVYLAAPLAVVQERLARNAGGRPSLTGLPPAEEAARLLAEREPQYRACADWVLEPLADPAATADLIAARCA
ncbi:MAG: shikimate kinase AroL [Planctomycetota bacterium]|jgi:shikimate kinase